MTAAGPKLTLLVPGLLGPVPELSGLPSRELPALSALRLLLSRGRRGATPAEGLDAILFQLFEVQSAPGGELPVAAVSRVLDGGMPDEAWWLRADPVFLQADMDRMLMSAHEELELSLDEARALAAELADVFAEEGWRFEIGAPHRWYLCPGESPRLSTTPLRQVRGRDVGAHLPGGEDARRWRTRLNEVQMVLHASPVNAEREARGLRPVNSLWFWGGGRMPQFGRCRWRTVWARDALARALAMHCGTATREPPADFGAWWAEEPDSGEHLIVLDGPEGPLRERDIFGWLRELERLERDWFAPLLAALRAGRVERLELLDGGALEVERRDLRRVWRRRRPRADLLAA